MKRRAIVIGALLALAACTPSQRAIPTPPPTPRVITATFLPPTTTPTASTTPIYIVVTSTDTPTTGDLGILPASPAAALLPTRARLASPTPFQTGVAVAAVPDQPQAMVCATCGGLRLRDAPGTAGNVLAMLDASTPLQIAGRSADNAWLQVITPDGTQGWIAADYAVVNVDLSRFTVTGEVNNAALSSGLRSAVAPDLPADAPPMSQIVTGITAHSRQIYLDGQGKGNIYNVFVSVGDSITANGAYLTQMTAGRYNLGAYSYYQPAVTWWNSLNGRGQLTFDPPHLAAAPGWSTLDVLNSDLGWPGVCDSGESPLVCEYRLNRPSVALIMLGTNDSGGIAPADYEANLRRILDITIERGIVPVLSTLPPRLDSADYNARIDAYNGIITGLARSYDIPLWNYRLALNNLPNQGMSADGVHPSVPPDGQNTTFDAEHLRYGFPMRNLTALHVLDQLWRQVLYDGGQTTAPPLASGDPDRSTTSGSVTTSTGSTTGAGYSCPGAPPPRLIVGSMGRVTPGVPNKLRAEPSVSATEIGSIPGGGQFTVVGGPTCADGYTWWQVNYQGAVGWTASGSASEYWVEP